MVKHVIAHKFSKLFKVVLIFIIKININAKLARIKLMALSVQKSQITIWVIKRIFICFFLNVGIT